MKGGAPVDPFARFAPASYRDKGKNAARQGEARIKR
jgi:hypothetical protein